MKLPRSARLAACLLLVFALLSAAAPAADPVPKWDPARTTSPEDLTELKSLQAAVNATVEKCTPATVALKYRDSNGSGVIVSEDGLILTAAHVIRDYPATFKGSGDPPPLPFTAGKKLLVMLPDGKEYEAKTLGINQAMDSGMVQLTAKGPKDGKWPFRPVGKSGDVKKQQWVVALGHPDGPKEGRPPVARLGRVLANNKGFLRTDCTIVGGDSGGPLFDLNGNVIGIHSRMVFPFSLAHNVHVPTDDFKTDWDKLLAGDWVDKPAPAAPKISVYFGVVFPDDDSEDAWLREVIPDAPAEKAGLKPGDTITKFNGTVVKSVKEFRKLLAAAKAGDKVTITARRGIETLTLTVTLVKL
jgi:serine protease Do